MPGQTAYPRASLTHPSVDTGELAELADRYGTPLIIMDLRRVRANLERISGALRAHLGERSQPAFAVKSCYLPEVLALARAAGWGVEVMSGFELEMVTAAGVPGSEVVLTGLGWGEQTCRAAVRHGVASYVVDTEADLMALAEASAASAAEASAGQRSRVLVRANLADRVADSFLEPDGKLGQCGDAAISAMIAAVRAEPALDFSGVHCHQFNRLTSPDRYHLALRQVAHLVTGLIDAGVPCPIVDIGGGVSSLTQLDLAGAPFEGFAEAAGQHLAGVPVEVIRSEFGRAVVGDAGCALGRVTAVKRTGRRCWVVLDIPTNTLIPIPGAVYPPLLVGDAAGRVVEICSFTDGTGSPVAFARDVPWPAPRVGDLVCLTDAGAYTTVFTELWAAAIPTLVQIGEGGSVSVRDGAQVTRRTHQTWYGGGAWQRSPSPLARPATGAGAVESSEVPMRDPARLPYVDLLVRVGEVNRCPGGKRTIRRIRRRLGIGPHTRVLEIGSNTGFTSIELVKISGCRAVGVDVNESAVAAARKNAAALAGGLADRIDFQVADASDLPFADASFDVIVCGGANTFIQNRERAFGQYHRVLRPYGFVSITNLYYRTPPAPELRAELREILGFEVPAYGLTDWLDILAPDGWELYDLATTDLAARPVEVIDQYVDRLCGVNLADTPQGEASAITEQWRQVMRVFNRNHAHLSFMELTLRRDDEPEQPEVFLAHGQFDPFFTRRFIGDDDAAAACGRVEPAATRQVEEAYQ